MMPICTGRPGFLRLRVDIFEDALMEAIVEDVMECWISG